MLDFSFPQVSQRMLKENGTLKLRKGPGDISVREDFTGVPVARPNLVWWESCCFQNDEALDVLVSITN